ncbi:hypothetical protein AVEN_133007-1 [Araneus ventricosus]|uniref:Uncharacterized protein n=1 Tax=Araneus ventricosus TaxID=182803 RepID=A0A4Y2M8A9_ARAVE|nr:hypothetical protein AVEN_133007-1 [Araneus ventricosus]
MPTIVKKEVEPSWRFNVPRKFIKTKKAPSGVHITEIICGISGLLVVYNNQIGAFWLLTLQLGKNTAYVNNCQERSSAKLAIQRSKKIHQDKKALSGVHITEKFPICNVHNSKFHDVHLT